jgi:hypothetical protein
LQFVDGPGDCCPLSRLTTSSFQAPDAMASGDDSRVIVASIRHHGDVDELLAIPNSTQALERRRQTRCLVMRGNENVELRLPAPNDGASGPSAGEREDRKRPLIQYKQREQEESSNAQAKE